MAQLLNKVLTPGASVSKFLNSKAATTYGIKPILATEVGTDLNGAPTISAAAQQKDLNDRLGGVKQFGQDTVDLKRVAYQNQQARLKPQPVSATVNKGAFKGGQAGTVGTSDSYRGSGNVVNGSQQAMANQLAQQAGGGLRSQILQGAIKMLGTPYAWGGGGIGNSGSRGTGKGTQNVIGVDCSGLTSYVYGQLGIKLPRYSGAQTSMGVRTNINNAKPGDLVGWAKGGHVAIYAGNGYVLESPRPGKRVQLRKLDSSQNVYAVRLKFAGE